MNAFAIAGGRVRAFSVPLRAPFVTALGRKESTTNVEVALRLAGGAAGRAEASGSVVLARQTPGLLASALRRMLARFRGRDARAFGPLAEDVWREFGATPAAAAAFECAAAEALCAATRAPLSLWLGGALDRVETGLTLSALGPEETAPAARTAARAGFRTLKVKVGVGGPAEDLARVLAAGAAGSRPRIILDGNQRLGAAPALRLVEACLKARLRVVLLEQPVAREDLKGLAAVRRRSPVPVAADESVRTPEEALKVIEADAADVINVKVAKTGLKRSLDVVALARAAGKRLMIGCMQETALGLEPSVHLACGTGAFDFVDLDSDVLLDGSQPRGRIRRMGAYLCLP